MEIQDERALADVQSILWTWKGDVSMVPVIWYYPKAALQPDLMDVVPLPALGNRLTVREYQRRWLDVLAFITGDPSGFSLALAAARDRFLSGLPPTVERDPSELTQVAFPVLGSAVVAPPQDVRARIVRARIIGGHLTGRSSNRSWRRPTVSSRASKSAILSPAP